MRTLLAFLLPSPKRVRSRLLAALALWWLVLSSVSACSTAARPAAPADGTLVDNGLVVTITAPKPPETGLLFQSGPMQVCGTVAVAPGVKLTDVTVAAAGKFFPATITQPGNGFCLAQPIDTLKVKDGPVTVVVQATGTLDATGSAQLAVQIDNTLPTAEIAYPADNSVFVEGLPVGVKIADKNFKSATLQWGVMQVDGGEPTVWHELLPSGSCIPDPKAPVPCAVSKQAIGAAMDKPGAYGAWLDGSGEGTAALRIKLSTADQAGNAAEAAIRVQIVKAPHFQDNTGVQDDFTAPIQDMQIEDMDGDGLPDAVVATSDGIALRPGLPASTTTVPATDACGVGSTAGVTGSCTFGVPGVPGAAKSAGSSISGGDMSHVLLLDLDGDGDFDVLATGTVAGKPVAWAALNVVQTVAAKDGSLSVQHALKLVDSKELPDEALSAALGDLDGDCLKDLIVGGKGGTGLTTLLLTQDPQCTAGDVSVPCKGADVASDANAPVMAKVTKAGIFPAKAYTAIHPGVTAISSIAVADFYADAMQNGDKPTAIDVCVGETARPIVSCYRNVKQDGTLEQAQDSYTAADAPDVHFIVATKWNADAALKDAPDLVVATSSKILRWLRGDHNGKFAFDPEKDCETDDLDVTAMALVAMGPAKTPMVMLVEDGHVGTAVPLRCGDPIASGGAIFGSACSSPPPPPPGVGSSAGDPGCSVAKADWKRDNEMKVCLASWILGGKVSKIVVHDVNGDGTQDVVALDGSTNTLPVSRTAADGDLCAPSVHHVCALQTTGHVARQPIAAMAFADFNGDKRSDLLLVGKRSWSLQPGASGFCMDGSGDKQYKWAWALNLFTNDPAPDHARLDPTPRMAEFAPNALGQTAQSGASSDCPDTPKSFGSVRDLAWADMDGDTMLDLVAVRDESDYELGTAKDVQPGPGCASNCQWNELNEVDNVFGIQNPAAGPPAKCCKNFAAVDQAGVKPLTGYGGAASAPIDRASAFVFLNGSKGATPFGLATAPACTLPVPTLVKPVWTMAAGINPVGVIAADFNQDGKTDIATLMPEKGNNQDKEHNFLAPRVRIFKGIGGNKWTNVQQPAGDYWPYIDPVTQKIKENIPVSYRTVGEGPLAIVGAPLGQDGWPGIYTLGGKYGNFSFLESLGNMGFKLATQFVVGPGATAFVVRDINPTAGDTVADVVYVVQDAIGVLMGNLVGGSPSFTSGGHLVDGTPGVDFVDTVDANQDGFLDLMMVSAKHGSVQFYLGDGLGHFVQYPSELRVLDNPSRIIRGNLTAAGTGTCFDLAVLSEKGATVLRNLDCQ